jgi:hypothetical protein
MRGATTFWIVVAVGVMVVAGTLDVLPPTVATHFDASGTANGWSSRRGYASFLAGIGVGLPLLIVGVAGVFARRAEGIARVREHIWWLACMFAMAALGTHLALLGANKHLPPQLPLGAALGLIAFPLACMVIWAVTWHRLFRPPPGSQP